jgi:long-chain acyl-CoA synthetase
MSTTPTTHPTGVIPLDDAATLADVFLQRIARTPEALAYRYFDAAQQCWRDISWAAAGRETARWRAALASEQLQSGDRVAMMLANGPEWVFFDLAAQSLGLVTVPLYTNDRLENAAYILNQTAARVLLIGNDIELPIASLRARAPSLQRLLVTGTPPPDSAACSVAEWLPASGAELCVSAIGTNSLATIVYTSGTTGRPKGVMLSHRNILWNIHAGLQGITVYHDDLFLSFLPLSHALERTIGFYLPLVAGAGVAFSRGIEQLAEDMSQIRPSILVAVPRIFERIYSKLRDVITHAPIWRRWLFSHTVNTGWRRFLHRQGRASETLEMHLWPIYERLVASQVKARFGGRLRLAVCGGAPLSGEVARLFIGLDIMITQGYGLTEAGPVVSVNRLDDNIPESVGPALPGIEVRIGANEELLTHSPSVMLGYWQNAEASAAVIDPDGWLHSGDKARMEGEHIIITGRLKEIIVLANGQKVSPADMETAITLDPLIEQAIIIGEGKPFLSALLVPESDAYQHLLQQLGLAPETAAEHPQMQQIMLQHVAKSLEAFPGYAKVLRVRLVFESWNVENGMMTPTMKLRRAKILAQHDNDVDALYQGH